MQKMLKEMEVCVCVEKVISFSLLTHKVYLQLEKQG